MYVHWTYAGAMMSTAKLEGAPPFEVHTCALHTSKVHRNLKCMFALCSHVHDHEHMMHGGKLAACTLQVLYLSIVYVLIVLAMFMKITLMHLQWHNAITSMCIRHMLAP